LNLVDKENKNPNEPENIETSEEKVNTLNEIR